MRRATTRFFAFVILALLGTPVAMHVVLHDLPGHNQHAAADAGHTDHHDDHEHPIVSSSVSQVASLTRAELPVVLVPAATPVAWTRIVTAERNIVSLGALRMDDDVGLQPLLSTFLI